MLNSKHIYIIIIRSTNLNMNTMYQFNIKYFPVHVNLKTQNNRSNVIKKKKKKTHTDTQWDLSSYSGLTWSQLK